MSRVPARHCARGPSPCERIPFAGQKGISYKTKGHLSQGKRTPIGNALIVRNLAIGCETSCNNIDKHPYPSPCRDVGRMRTFIIYI